MDAAKPTKQRILNVFNGKMPDRVPNFEVLIDNPTLSAIMGRPMPGASARMQSVCVSIFRLFSTKTLRAAPSRSIFASVRGTT
jgi:hypothetical protein